MRERRRWGAEGGRKIEWKQQERGDGEGEEEEVEERE